MIQKIKRLYLFCVLLCFSVVANLIIKIVPFKTLMGILTNNDCYIASDVTPLQKSRIKRVLYYLNRINEITPWRVKCYEQAVTTIVLCRIIKVSVAVYFGVNRDREGSLKAHAWTESGGYLLSGGLEARYFTPVYKRAYIPELTSGTR